jgi:hypothetical protein
MIKEGTNLPACFICDEQMKPGEFFMFFVTEDGRKKMMHGKCVAHMTGEAKRITEEMDNLKTQLLKYSLDAGK